MQLAADKNVIDHQARQQAVELLELFLHGQVDGYALAKRWPADNDDGSLHELLDVLCDLEDRRLRPDEDDEDSIALAAGITRLILFLQLDRVCYSACDPACWPFPTSATLDAALAEAQSKGLSLLASDTAARHRRAGEFFRTKRADAVVVLDTYLNGQLTGAELHERLILAYPDRFLEKAARRYMKLMPRGRFGDIPSGKRRRRIEELLGRLRGFLRTDLRCKWKDFTETYDLLLAIANGTFFCVAAFAFVLVLPRSMKSTPGTLLAFAGGAAAVACTAAMSRLFQRQCFKWRLFHGRRKYWPFAGWSDYAAFMKEQP